jgi:ADP-ribosylglycohydrolase
MSNYREQTYAGLLGKIIGVYLGRTVEGWTYENIQARFGNVAFYVSDKVGMPLIVPDDDISGAFTFYRALEDNGFPPDISAKQIGDTWLNYVIENKTILWWGGLSRSTEHTAFIRLKQGITPPDSGSIALNGQSMAEQIGAEIFIDPWAMVNPNDPDRAVDMARKAASVSHGGMAVEAACFLAAMEAMAFTEKDLNKLIADGVRYVQDTRLLRLIHDLTNECQKSADWRTVREWIACHHGYDKYPGNCPIATNHVTVLMALLFGGDDFQESISIAASAGWDTDCNAGNVGCLNGIRLGLAALNGGADLRAPVNDRLYVVSADGGECISDTVRETRKILTVAAALRQEAIEQPTARFAFEYPDSTQGFVLHPACTMDQAVKRIGNAFDTRGEYGLLIQYEGLAKGTRGVVSVQTFIDPEPKGVKGTSYFEVIASPTLYATQTVRASMKAYCDDNPDLRFFIDYYDENNDIATIMGVPIKLSQGINPITWPVPDTDGHSIYRLGLELTSGRRLDGEIALLSLDWSGAPEHFVMGKSMQLSPSLTPWTTSTTWLNMFVSSAQNFAPDYTATFSVSHPDKNGVVTTGTRDWRDYTVESTITFSQQTAAGLVARSRGHRRYYAAVLTGGNAAIVKRRDGDVSVLTAIPFDYRIDETHALAFRVQGGNLILRIDGQRVVEAVDDEYASGGAGFLVDEGAILCDGFTVRTLSGRGVSQ